MTHLPWDFTIAIAELLPPIEAGMVRKINDEISSGRAERLNI